MQMTPTFEDNFADTFEADVAAVADQHERLNTTRHLTSQSTANQSQAASFHKVKIHPCPHCPPPTPRTFKTFNDLERHIKSVHWIFQKGDKYWVCPCDNCPSKVKIWPRLDNFKVHVVKLHGAWCETMVDACLREYDPGEDTLGLSRRKERGKRRRGRSDGVETCSAADEDRSLAEENGSWSSGLKSGAMLSEDPQSFSPEFDWKDKNVQYWNWVPPSPNLEDAGTDAFQYTGTNTFKDLGLNEDVFDTPPMPSY